MAPDAGARRADPFAPLTSEQLAVSDGHDIYVESVGRSGGIGAVYLHGGPGSGCQADHRRLFDPERFRGWGGGKQGPVILSETDATPSYLPGPIRALMKQTARVMTGTAYWL